MLITSATMASLQTGFSASYQRGFSNAASYADRIAMTVRSNNALELYGWMLQLPNVREWIGPRLIHNMTTAEYQLKNKLFEQTVGVGRVEIEDEALGIYAPRFEMMGYSARIWPDQQLKAAIRAGNAAAGNTFDGVPFFSTAHTLNAAGNQSNNFTLALDATNYNTVRSAMMSYLNSDGEALGVMPNLLVVPPQLEKAARDIVSANQLTNGGTNVMAGTAEVLVLPQLADDATAWYLLDTTKPVKPFVWQLRDAPEFVRKDSPSDENVFHQDLFLYGSRMRGAAGYGLWFLAARSKP